MVYMYYNITNIVDNELHDCHTTLLSLKLYHMI